MNVREPLVELSLRFSTTLFPFRVESMISALPHLGFVVAEGVKEPRFTGRLGISGPLGTKGDLVSSVNTERNSLGVRGTDFETVVQAFETIEELIQHRLGVTSEGNIAFYELQARAFFEAAGKRPITAIERHFEGIAAISSFASVLKRPVSNLGFRLVPPGVGANSPSWFEIRVEPEVLQSDQLYDVYFLYRDPVRDDVLAIAKQGFSLLEQLVKIVES